MKRLALGCMLLAAASVASATTTFIAQGNTNPGNNSIFAEADFTFTNTTLTLTLTNLLVNPTSVGQNISDFEFTIASLSATNATLAPYPATKAPQLVTINAPSYVVSNTNSTTGPPGWTFDYSAGNFALNGLGAAHTPAYTIVGPAGASGYTNANPSLGGPHNPFIYETATWVFNIVNPSGLAQSITNVNFSFGTTAGDNYTCGAPGQFCYAPEPGSWLLIGSGLAVLLVFARKSARKTTA